MRIRRLLLATAFVTPAALLAVFLMAPLLIDRAWVGHHQLEVRVHVIDPSRLEQIQGATVTIFKGPKTPIDSPGVTNSERDFLPESDANAQRAVTDKQGRCSFLYRFWAAGRSGPLTYSGYVDTSGTWLRVTAPNQGVALIPLDRQSVRPRDINDNTPLIVTVVLSVAGRQ